MIPQTNAGREALRSALLEEAYWLGQPESDLQRVRLARARATIADPDRIGLAGLTGLTAAQTQQINTSSVPQGGIPPPASTVAPAPRFQLAPEEPEIQDRPPRPELLPGALDYSGDVSRGMPDVNEGLDYSGSPLDFSTIFTTYQQGGYGAVGSSEARNTAIYNMAYAIESAGTPAVSAMIQAEEAFNAQFPPSTDVTTTLAGGGAAAGGEAAGGAAGGGATGVTGELQGQLPFDIQRQEAVRQRAPLLNPFQGYLNRQAGDLEALYGIQDIGGELASPEQSFTDWLLARPGGEAGQYGTTFGPSVKPETFAPYLQKVYDAIMGPTAPGGLQGFREYYGEAGAPGGMEPDFEQAQGRQRDLALLASFGNISPGARPYYQRAGRRAFNQFRFENPESAFLPWFMAQGGFFPGGPSLLNTNAPIF